MAITNKAVIQKKLALKYRLNQELELLYKKKKT